MNSLHAVTGIMRMIACVLGRIFLLYAFSFLLTSPARAVQFFVDETSSRLPQIEDVTIAAFMADMDGDGDLDIVVENGHDPSSYSYVLMNDGTGHFPADSLVYLFRNQDFTEGAIGDIETDGDYDILFGGDPIWGQNELRLFVNYGSGSFTDETETRIESRYHTNIEVVFIDFDSDLDLDIIFANQGWSLLYKNFQGGYFYADPFVFFPKIDGSCWAVADGDIDGDFDSDILFVRGYYTDHQLLVNDNRFFRDETQDRLPEGTNFEGGSIDLGDFDRDGDLDIVVTHDNRLGIFINDGRGYFTEETGMRMPQKQVTAISILSCDVENDGDSDILFSRSSSGEYFCTLYMNDGQGVFTDVTEEHLPDAGNHCTEVVLGDVDGDGDVDIYACQSDWSQDPWDPIGLQNQLLINVTSDVRDDHFPPVIAKTLEHHDTGDTTNPYIITSSVWDNSSVAPGEVSAILHYRTGDSGEFNQRLMYECGRYLFRRDIPPQREGTRIEYYIEARDRRLNVALDPQAAPDSLYSFTVATVGIEEDRSVPGIPERITLTQNYPNPFNPRTAIGVEVPPNASGLMSLVVYDLRGRLVKILFEGRLKEGRHVFTWHGKNEQSMSVSSGVYLCVLRNGEQVVTRKLTLVK